MTVRPVAAIARAGTTWTAVAVASVAVAIVLLSACTPAVSPLAASPSPSVPLPSVSSAPSPVPSGAATSDDAAALVRAADPRFAGLGPLDPNVIGACCSMSTVAAADGWRVSVEIGWGDCPAGCIDRHHWVYSVTRAGVVTLVSEDGPPIPAGIPGRSGDTTGLVGIRGVASAGPVCPVERPGDPNCAPRPVAGATIHVLDATGTEVAQLESDATGAFSVTLPPGRYLVRADPVEGLMATPQPVEIDVATALAQVDLMYDTGIR